MTKSRYLLCDINRRRILFISSSCNCTVVVPNSKASLATTVREYKCKLVCILLGDSFVINLLR